jgi:cytochrome P450
VPLTRRSGDPDPYPNYTWLRENAPVSALYSPHVAGTTWLVASYELARGCLADPRLSNDSRTGRSGPDHGQDEYTARGLLSLDRPEHTRLRSLVNGAFSPSAVARWRPMIEQVCHSAVDRFVHKGRMDLVDGYALPVPVAIIHEVLGVPEAEREEPARVFDLFFRSGLAQPPETQPYHELLGYLDHIVRYKRRHPGSDVVTALLRDLDRGDVRDERELRSMLLGIMGAGHVTTVQFFGSAALRLMTNPDQVADLLTGRARWSDTLNELLRFDSPIQATQHRYATEDMRIGDVLVRKGDAVLVSVAAANRDPARFTEPGVLDLRHDGPSNLAFGHGVHLCLGAHLARLEAQLGLDILFRRLPEPRLAIPPDEVVWTYGPMLRGPRSLPVTFRA